MIPFALALAVTLALCFPRSVSAEMPSNNAAYYVFELGYREEMNSSDNLLNEAYQSFDTTSLIASTDTLYFREEEKEFLTCENDWSGDLGDLNEFTISTWLAIESPYGRGTVMSKNKECNENLGEATFDTVDSIGSLNPSETVVAGENPYCEIGTMWDLSVLASHLQFEISLRDDGSGKIQDYILLSSSALAPKVWHHIAITFDSNALKFYINGKEDASYVVRGQLLDYSSTTFVGNSDSRVDNDLYTGLMNSLKVWDRMLDQTEIEALHTTTDPVKPEHLLAVYTWTSEQMYFNAVNNARCEVSSTLSRALQLNNLVEIECASDNILQNLSSIVGISTTVNVQIEPEIPRRKSEEEVLLDMDTIYQDPDFLPIRVLTVNNSMYVTAINTGVWKFDFVYDEKENMIALDEPALVVPDQLCDGTDNTTNVSAYPGLCLDIKISQNNAVTKVHIMTSIESREAMRVYGEVEGPIMPFDMAPLSDGTLLITDVGAHGIWQYFPDSGKIEVYAGVGPVGRKDGNAKSTAEFASPTGIVVIDGDVVFIADTWNNQIRKVEGEIVSTLAGSSSGRPGYADGLRGSDVMFNRPFGLSLSEDGSSLLVADTHNHVIREVQIANGSTSTLSGAIQSGFSDGIGPLASFGSPVDLAQIPWSENSTFVTDIENFALRKVDRVRASVSTPIQMISPGLFYSPDKDTGEFKGCTLDSQLDCIGKIDVLPSYGISSFENLLILADTTEGALKVLKRNGKTLEGRLIECKEEQEEREHIKVIIAASVSTAFLMIVLSAGGFALYSIYKRKKAKLDEKELHLKNYVQEEIFDHYHIEHSSSPLDQALAFLNGITQGRICSASEAEKVRKLLICGSIMNGDVSKPLDLDQGLNNLKNLDAGTGIIAQVAGPKPVYRRSRSKKRWQKTFAAYQAAHMLRANSMSRDTPSSIPGSLPTRAELERRESFTAISAACNKFHVNLFELSEKSGGQPLSTFAAWLLDEYGLQKSLPLNADSFSHFAGKIEEKMHDVPYHNKMHVTGVLQAMDYFLAEGGLMSFIVDDYELLACLLAAIVHDYQHPGVNNEFLVITSHDLALTYNDQAPLENFHVASAYSLMKRNRELDFMERVPQEDQKHIRGLVIDLVLATDMSKHFEILNQGKLLLSSLESKKFFKSAHKEFVKHKAETSHGGLRDRGSRCFLTCHSDKGYYYMDDAERALVLRIAMKCADLNHVFQTFENHELWCDRITEEFCQQGDKEISAGLSPDAMFSRKSTSPLAKSQLVFMDVIVLPLFELLSQLLPETSPMLDQVRENRNKWQSKLASWRSSQEATLSSSQPLSSEASGSSYNNPLHQESQL
jgi:hypothetical protein